MKKAGYDSGKCEGDCEILMVGETSPPGKDTAEVVQGPARGARLQRQLPPVDHDIMYTKFCSVPEQQPEVCPNVGWLKDFNDPQSMLDDHVQRRRRSIPENNSNWPQLDDPGGQQGDGGGRR